MFIKKSTMRPLNTPPAAGRKSFPSPWRIFIILSVLLFLTEFVVMHLLPFLPELKPWALSLTDATLMLLLVSPALYHLVLRPMHRQIGERQRAEDELLQINEQLRRETEVRRTAEQELTVAELRYRTVADFTYDWEYWEAPKDGLGYCSPSCERITGYSAQEFIADAKLLQQIVHPEDADIWRQHRHEAIAEPGPRTIQFRIRRKDGGLRWVDHVCQPVSGPDGDFLGIRASNRDITERIQAELETRQLRKELAHVTRVTTVGQLAASLAHELNQPLTAISCNAEAAESFLAADQPDLKEVQEALSEIRHDSQRAGGVIQNLRALFKKTGQQRSVLQLNGVIEETLDLLRGELVLNGTSVQLELAPDLPVVLGDRIELQQLVLNLVINALEAMTDLPGPRRRLHVNTNLENPKVIHAFIQDCGAGIPEAQLSRLFEPFFTTKATGMGMGLAICHSIIEAHGGRLWAVNNPAQGATFHFTLPISQGENA